MASNPLLKFKKEILTQIVFPKLEGLLYSEKGDLSVNELWKLFREKYDCTVSLREFKEWCDDLNLKPQQTTVWNLPKKASHPLPKMDTQAFAELGELQTSSAYVPTDADIDQVLFDNEA